MEDRVPEELQEGGEETQGSGVSTGRGTQKLRKVAGHFFQMITNSFFAHKYEKQPVLNSTFE